MPVPALQQCGRHHHQPCVPCDNGPQMPAPAPQQCGRHHKPDSGPQQPAVHECGYQPALRGTNSLQSTTEAPRSPPSNMVALQVALPVREEGGRKGDKHLQFLRCQRQLSRRRSVAAITSQQSTTVATPGQLSLTVATLSESSSQLLVATRSPLSNMVATRCKRQHSLGVAAITSQLPVLWPAPASSQCCGQLQPATTGSSKLYQMPAPAPHGCGRHHQTPRLPECGHQLQPALQGPPCRGGREEGDKRTKPSLYCNQLGLALPASPAISLSHLRSTTSQLSECSRHQHLPLSH